MAARVRFAPSPTGYLHVGGARTLLFNWLYARKAGGSLILRIEDTDQARSTRQAEKQILEDIQALSFSYDEGPEVPGSPHGPYRQSERLPIYAKYVDQLIAEDKVYPCFCSDELLTQKREVALKLGKVPHYDGTCAKLSKAEAKAKLERGEKAGMRFRAPHKSMKLHDLVRGDIEFKDGTVGDFFITRSGGMPVYNFCCVLDDHLMEITHVVRGEDHLSNTARQLMIYDAFGWKTPQFAHIAMVLGADRQKLSKRSGDVSVHEYLAQGYLPETLINFLALLGWWPPSDFKPHSGHPEILSREELIKAFSFDGLQKAPGVFDVQKLRWMNAYYLHHLPAGEIAAMAKPFFEAAKVDLSGHDATWFEEMVGAVRGEATLLSDLPKAAALFFEKQPMLEADAKGALTGPVAAAIVGELLTHLESGKGPLSSADVTFLEKQIAAKTGAKGKALFMPIRAISTGKTHGPELNKILPLLGRETVIQRIKELKKQAGL